MLNIYILLEPFNLELKHVYVSCLVVEGFHAIIIVESSGTNYKLN